MHGIEMNFIHSSFKHGKNLKIGHFCYIHKNVEVGNNVTIESCVELRPGTVIGNHVKLESGVKTSGNCRIGNNVIICYNSIIDRDVTIEDGVFISPQMTTNYLNAKMESEGGIVIGRDAFIGTDVTIEAGKKICSGAIVGEKALVKHDIKEPGVYVGIPARKFHDPRVKIGRNFRAEPGVVLGGQPTLIDRGKHIFEPSAGILIGDNVWIGTNTVIMYGNHSDTTIGNYVHIGAQCNIGHDSRIGNGSTIINGTLIAGHVEIGRGARINMGCLIRNRVKIGANAEVGMGSIVVSDIPPNVVAFGNPCKVIRKKPLSVKNIAKRFLR